MSDHTPEAGPAGTGSNQTTGVLRRTWFAVRTALRRRDSRVVFGFVVFAYVVGYLYAAQQLSLRGGLGAYRYDLLGYGYDIRVVDSPLATLFEQGTSAVNFKPVAIVETEFFTYLFSLNTIIGTGLGVLVGVNLAITYLAWRQPAACGIGTTSAGLLAGIPAILSGSACCGPVLVIVLGVQATGILAPGVFELLLPVAVVLLVGSLLLVGRQIDPELVTETEPPA